MDRLPKKWWLLACVQECRTEFQRFALPAWDSHAEPGPGASAGFAASRPPRCAAPITHPACLPASLSALGFCTVEEELCVGESAAGDGIVVDGAPSCCCAGHYVNRIVVLTLGAAIWGTMTAMFSGCNSIKQVSEGLDMLNSVAAVGHSELDHPLYTAGWA